MASIPRPAAQSPLEAAIDYAARGIPVFPLHHMLPNGQCSCGDEKCGKNKAKHPRTQHGFKDATTDEEQIRRWWRRWPQANIGIPTGTASGWIVIDIDPRNGGNYDALAAMGRMPTTLTAETGSGGLHLVFAYPLSLDGKLDNGNNKLGEGHDVKADGGYIVAAPSIHQSGRRYQWITECAPAPLPTWLLKRLTVKDKEPLPIRKPAAAQVDADDSDRDAYWLAWALAQSGPGTGDATGFKLAQQLLTDPDVRDIDATLASYARQATLDTSDPFDEDDIDRWLKSAQQSSIVRRGEPAKRKRTKPVYAQQSAAAVPTVREERPKLQAVPPPPAPPDDDDSALLKGEPDDNGNAETMYRLYGREILFTPAYGWLRWTGTHWQDVPEAIVQQHAITTLKRRRHAAVEADAEAIIKTTKADKSRVQGCLTLFKSYVIEPNVAAFDADADLLNVRNGVLNLRTGQLAPHVSSQRFTYCVPVEYDPNADMSGWQAFVLDALGRDEVAARYFQVCAGYSLTGHTREEKMFYLYGPPRAGKGTVTETLLALLPHPLSTEADFASFTAKRDNDSQNFDLAELKPSRIVIASESNRYQALNPAKIKSMTGGNYIRCAFKHKDMFTYRPQFKVWLVSNHQVNADADDDALWGRVQVFTFPHSHLGSEDVSLKARMRSPENLRGVLRWAVEGALAWYQAERLTPPETVVAATQEHRARQDYLQQWWDDCCTAEAETWTPSGVLLKSYREWCDGNAIKPMRQNEFADALVKRFGCVFKRQTGGVRGYNGVHVE